MRRPWRPHYTKDWRTDPFVRSLSLEVRAIYLELIDIEWDEDGLDPAWLVSPFSFLCGAIGCHWRTFQAAWTILGAKYTLQDGVKMRSRRVQEELRIASERSQEASNAAKSRWSKHATALPSQDIHNTSQDRTKENIAPPPAPLILLPPGEAKTSARAQKFDFASVYGAFPRKKGKTKGIARLEATVRTPEAFEQLQLAVKHFAAMHRAEGTELKFIPHFSTWVGTWQDYIEPPQVTPQSYQRNGKPEATYVKPKHFKKSDIAFGGDS